MWTVEYESGTTAKVNLSTDAKLSDVLETAERQLGYGDCEEPIAKITDPLGRRV